MQLLMSLPSKVKKTDSKVIGFKLDDENRAKLEAQAEQLGTKRNFVARDMVLKALNAETDVTGLIIALNHQLFALREEMALVAEALLTHAGKVSPDEAKKWADENIKPDA